MNSITIDLILFQFDFNNYTTNYEDLLNDAEIDIIAIYTPDHLHADHIKQALLHGKHVVCTKPFIDDLSRAKELLELQAQTGKKVFVGQSSRFFEPYKRQRKDFEAGEIGELITIESHYNADHRWFLEKKWALEDSFKWLYGGLSHPVDFIRWYLPNIEEVMGYGMISSNGKTAGLKNEDTMHFIFKSTDGRIARVSGTYTSPTQPTTRDSGMSCVLRGTLGASQADYHELRYAITDKTGEEKIVNQDDYVNKEEYWKEGTPWQIQKGKEVSVLVKQGYQSSIDKFKLEDENGNDITEQILHLPKVYLIFSYKPKEISKEEKCSHWRQMRCYRKAGTTNIVV